MGKAMSVAVFERLRAAARRAAGYSHADAWETGERRAKLTLEAKHDTLPPTTIRRIQYMRTLPPKQYNNDKQPTPHILWSLGMTHGRITHDPTMPTPLNHKIRGNHKNKRIARKCKTKRSRTLLTKPALARPTKDRDATRTQPIRKTPLKHGPPHRGGATGSLPPPTTGLARFGINRTISRISNTSNDPGATNQVTGPTPPKKRSGLSISNV